MDKHFEYRLSLNCVSAVHTKDNCMWTYKIYGATWFGVLCGLLWMQSYFKNVEFTVGQLWKRYEELALCVK